MREAVLDHPWSPRHLDIHVQWPLPRLSVLRAAQGCASVAKARDGRERPALAHPCASGFVTLFSGSKPPPSNLQKNRAKNRPYSFGDGGEGGIRTLDGG